MLKLFDDGAVLFAHGFEKEEKIFMLENLKKISDYFGVKYCLAVSSGTAAIKIALKALGVRE